MANFSYIRAYQALAVEAQYRMSVVELFQHTVQLAAQAPVLANPRRSG
jgi:hypothetical protein